MATPTSSSPASPVRGAPSRHTEFMEQLQIAYVGAIAAAAGCIVSEPRIDDGIDMQLMHKSGSHSAIPDRVARLDVQLKSTSSAVGRVPLPGAIGVDMSQDRFSFYSTVAPTTHKIVVVMSLPALQADWTTATHSELAVMHCAY